MVGEVFDFDAHEEEDLDGGEGSDIPRPPEIYLQEPSPTREAPRHFSRNIPSENGSSVNLRVRTRPMPNGLIQKWPDVFSMLITNKDGSQILFVRGKGG